MDMLISWDEGVREALTFSPTRIGTSNEEMNSPVLISCMSMCNISMLLAGAIGSGVMTNGKVVVWSVAFEGWSATSAGTPITVVEGIRLLGENEASHTAGRVSLITSR